jgi:tRNA(Ile)-lysidine synthase
MPAAGSRLLVALSGGADSVGLLDTLHRLAEELDLQIAAAHLDHRLRPDSGRDRAFCAELCSELGVAFYAGESDVRERARRTGEGLEGAAREARYAFLRSIQGQCGAEAIAVAHTRDDLAETLLLRLIRGSGSDGLAAMTWRRGDVVRPLLAVTRDEVRRHLRQTGRSWLEDPSNADLGFARNRVRHELLPYLESRFNPRARAVLARTAELLADEAEALEARARELYARAARPELDGIRVETAALRDAEPALARRLLRRAIGAAGGRKGLSRHHVDRVLDLVRRHRPGRRLPLPGGRVACFRTDSVWFGPPRRPRPFALDLDVPGTVELPDGSALVAQPCPASERAAGAVMAWPGPGTLTVRTRRPGDRVRLRGRDVSLKRYLLERRVPADRRGELPLVAAGTRVLWVAGEVLEAPGAGRGVRIELRPARPGSHREDERR